MPINQHIEIDGELVITCCSQCMQEARRTPCKPCVKSGPGYRNWKENYLQVEEISTGNIKGPTKPATRIASRKFRFISPRGKVIQETPTGTFK